MCWRAALSFKRNPFFCFGGSSRLETSTGRGQEDKLENNIDGEFVGRLIYQPGGYGDENISHMSLTVTATRYLDQINQWEAANIERRNEALRYIRIGGFSLHSMHMHRNENSMSVNVTCAFM